MKLETEGESTVIFTGSILFAVELLRATLPAVLVDYFKDWAGLPLYRLKIKAEGISREEKSRRVCVQASLMGKYSLAVTMECQLTYWLVNKGQFWKRGRGKITLYEFGNGGRSEWNFKGWMVDQRFHVETELIPMPEFQDPDM